MEQIGCQMYRRDEVLVGKSTARRHPRGVFIIEGMLNSQRLDYTVASLHKSAVNDRDSTMEASSTVPI
ncbi:hypothetical protein BDQ94DRAFT_13058 [Aspergillus welwitschiae]|uniref:Uncharacterized protein n=1 Tax=Aspergillus welwitschiae TaxID=1341132 RepID=A0A3F3PIC1_9EURO|nr:hypothetical protein BDQ94DRAFT_13058 [Aspergillus welwitschiae]RDH26607.1 hypothetical protein BDQ94DRAFT_13058 [Aspergillus welwitschiae]